MYNVLLLQQDLEAFYAAPYDVEVALEPRLTSNIIVLNCMIGPVSTLGAVAAASATTTDAEW
jgi:hypothetical protein